MKTENKLIRLIAEQMIEAREIKLESTLVDIGYDSLKFIALVVKMEAAFEMEFEDQYLNHHEFNTVYDLLKYLESRMKLAF
jgi:acyl carrier protein